MLIRIPIIINIINNDESMEKKEINKKTKIIIYPKTCLKIYKKKKMKMKIMY